MTDNTDEKSAEKLHAALIKERGDHKASREILRAAREKIDELTAQLNANAVTKDPSQEKIAGYLDQALQSRLAQATAEQLAKVNALETELATLRKTADDAKATLANKTIEAEIRAASTKHGVLPTAINDIVTLGKLSLKYNDDGTVATADGINAHDYVDSLKAVSPFFWPTAVGSSGTKWADGRPPGGMGMSEIGGLAMAGMAGNPFDPTSSAFNLTKAGEILKSDPTLAQKLQSAASQK